LSKKLEDDFLAHFITVDAFHMQFYYSSSSYSLNVEEEAAISLVASIQYHDSFKQMFLVVV
jgi:hypothetical protein